MKVCIVCGDKCDLKDFTDISFKKCCDVILIRRQRGLKYGDLQLTHETRDKYAYHIACYRNITCLKRKYWEGYSTQSSSKENAAVVSGSSERAPTHDTNIDSPIPVVSTTFEQPSTSKQSLETMETRLSLFDPDRQSPSLIDIASNVPGSPERVPTCDTNKNSLIAVVSATSEQPSASKQSLETMETRISLFDPDCQSPSLIESDSIVIEVTGFSASQTREHDTDKLTQFISLTNVQPSSSKQATESMEIKISTPAKPDQSPCSDVLVDQTNIRNFEDQGKREEKCIFCCQMSKRVGSKRQFVSKGTKVLIHSIRDYANSLGDIDIIEKLTDFDNIYYHPICRSLYQKKYEQSLDVITDHIDWHEKRKVHRDAFEVISLYINSEIIDKDKVVYLVNLFSMYKYCLKEFSDIGSYNLENFTPQHLQDKIKKTFGDSIIIAQSQTQKSKKVVYRNGIDYNSLVDQVAIHETEEQLRLQNTAYLIRSTIKNLKRKPLPEKIRPNAIIEGECDIPDSLLEFITHLVKGPDARRKLSDDDNVRVKSVCQDLIFSVHKGKIKPDKHLKLGLAMKSLTGSSKVLTILNRLGHSISYTVAEELETELVCTAHDDNELIPAGISVDATLSTHLAFDNYDRYVETSSGKNTLHDTVGIIYQFAKDETEDATDKNEESEPNASVTKRRRRRFEQIPPNITPYYKKPKAVTFLKSPQNIPNSSTSREKAIVKDIVWIMSLARLPEDTPMWLGYNSKTTIDESQMQVIDYLPQINQSPTSYAVVQETLNYAEKVRTECQQDDIVVTYDLAIAKMAQQIQIEESPRFDSIFINFGGFHVQLAFFKALGKFLDSCGIENILIESEIIAAGSLNSIMSGKHFNRCKKIHPLLSAALQCLHFEMFLSETELQVEQIDEHLKAILNGQTEAKADLTLPPLLSHYVKEYKKFTDATFNGNHGKTPQFYMIYIEFMNTYFRFIRSIKTSDFQLYLDSVYDLANMFFIFNHPNYARWLLKHHTDLIDIKTRKPQLVAEFERGAFGIKRTNIRLSRSPVDLTLEQTINADAGNRLTGLTHLTNSVGARQRWALGHTLMTKVTSALVDDLNMTKKDDVTSELKQNKMNRNIKLLKNLINELKKRINPFDRDLDTSELYNISSGRAAKEETSQFLLNVSSTGKELKLKFIEECNNDSTRFEKPIKNNKILNFASECMKRSQKDKNNDNIVSIKMQRDVFGHLLSIALENKIDMEECLSYPMAPAPPALCEYNGDMAKTDKSKLARHLKLKIEKTMPTEEILMVDGFHFLRTLGVIPETFGQISELILTKLCRTSAREIHLVFDQYMSPSIKDPERQKRDTQDVSYTISGPTQKRDGDFKKSLNNIKFKQSLIQFLSKNWQMNDTVSIIQDKKIYLTVDSKCYSYEADATKSNIIKREEESFTCNHEEADTRLIFHVNQTAPNSKILIRASDTDILVILLGNINKFINKEIWITPGLAKDSYSCTSLAEVLGFDLCRALPAFHALTGCDFTASFKGKGKIRPFEILTTSPLVQYALASLTEACDLEDMDKMEKIQAYINRLYGVKDCDEVNVARLILFNNKFKNINKTGTLLKRARHYDPKSIPPCWRTLKQKILRTILVSSLWNNATEKNCSLLNPEDYGWILCDNQYKINWFNGDPTPMNVANIIINSDEEDNISVGSSDTSESD